MNRNGRAIVFVRGDIDMASSQAFRDALLTAQRGAPDVMVDLSEVLFIDSTGINALIQAYRRAPDRGSLRLVSPRPAVRRVFEITGVSELLRLEPQHLTRRQVTYNTSGWRQWMTDETTKDDVPVAEIIEVGPRSNWVSASVHCALESERETKMYESLDKAMRAAEHHGSPAPQTSER
jgi:anti-sigma B factor antagonist